MDGQIFYTYDANGNMSTRIVGSDSYTLFYDAENRLVEVQKNNTTIATYTYDGDGKMTSKLEDGDTTVYIRNYLEVYIPAGSIPTPTATQTPMPTSTRTLPPTRTLFFTYTPANSRTPTITKTATATPVPTNTGLPTNTKTSTPTNTSTYTATVTRTKTPTKTSGPSSTPTVTRTKTPTATITKTSTVTLTRTKTPTNTSYAPTKTYTPTISPTVTNTVTRTPTQTYTVTPTSIAPGGQVWKFYYYAGSSRIAMREVSQFANVVTYIFTDHLGSTNVTADTNGIMTAFMLYTAWGETRYTTSSSPTDYGYTGQREETEIGLYYYNARWYDPALGRFVQADTIVPGAGNASAYDRYAYTLNNPIRLIDPSGHTYCDFGNCPKPRGTSEQISTVIQFIKKGIFANIDEGLLKLKKTTAAIQICGGYDQISLDDENPNDPNPFYNESTGFSTKNEVVTAGGVISAIENIILPFSNVQRMKQYYESQGLNPNVFIDMYYTDYDSNFSIYQLTFTNLSGQDTVLIGDLTVDYIEIVGQASIPSTISIPIWIDKYYFGKHLPITTSPVSVDLDNIVTIFPDSSITGISLNMINKNPESSCLGTLKFIYEK